MNNKASITALMSSFGRAFHAENEEHPVFADHLAKELMTADEYAAVQSYLLGGAQFLEPEIDPAKQEPKELLRRLVNVHIAPSPLCRAAYTEKALKAAVLTGTKQYVILGSGLDTFDTMLSALSSICANGSALVFDYPDEDFFAAPEKRVQNTIMMAKAGGEPMQSAFSYSELEKLLEKHGFLIYELLTPDDIQRDVIDKAGADLKAFEHVNYCLAVRKN